MMPASLPEVLPARPALLLVDDVPANLVALQAVLEPLDARLVNADSGQAALKAVLQEDFACIVLDVQMPDLDGIDTAVLIKMRDRSRHIPILFITAHLREEAQLVRAYSAGAVDYILKPFNPDFLRTKVQVFLDLYRHEQALQVAERAYTEQARAEGAQRFRSLLDSTTEGIWGVDLDGHCTFANPACVRMLGFRDADELLGRSMHTLVHHSHPDGTPYPAETCRILGAFRTGHTADVEDEVFFHADGHAIPVHYLASPLFESGQVAGAVVAFSDRTEGQRLQTALEDAVQLRDDFLADAGHELRTPLTSLRLQLELLERALGSAAPPAVSVRLVSARRQVGRLSSLVESLLVVGQLKNGGMRLEPARTDLVEVVREALERVDDRFEGTGSTVTLEAPAPVVGQWDALRLDQVAVNLLTNAAKYGGGRPVAVRVWQEGPLALLSVRDEGIGIPAEVLPRLFERFERGAAGRQYGGLGLGLSITQQIVQAHGGQLRVVSAPGEGATFTVELPLAGPAR